MYFAAIDESADTLQPALTSIHGGLSSFESEVVKRLQEVERETFYLVNDLPKAAHLSLCSAHYSAFFERAGAVMFAELLRGPFRLWGFGREARDYAITLKKTVYDPREGELSLDLFCGSKRVFTIAFTLLPGSLFQLAAPTVAVITRVQGIPHRRELIRETMEAMNDVAPPYALLAALRGVCEAFGIDTIIGCPAVRQIKFDMALEAVFLSNYDDFFTAVGAVRRPDGYFALTLPMAQKPLSEIKRGHRIRTRLKRAIKAQIMASTIAALRDETEAELVVFDEPNCTAKRLLDPLTYRADLNEPIPLAA